ncbi:hypothetical protein THIOM_001293 [Candidatus Thiomargarita nelsonii]|uniref:Uncharacterized protein n=1 Tax=Candidatus Thiomargarita nelsonii TaxID=1003181 RepID=A0A176S4M1_9GAMM|nr:hypothetical protein THIOM_001293 [Candidatus Thiomargarita nelsonii]
MKFNHVKKFTYPIKALHLARDYRHCLAPQARNRLSAYYRYCCNLIKCPNPIAHALIG